MLNIAFATMRAIVHYEREELMASRWRSKICLGRIADVARRNS